MVTVTRRTGAVPAPDGVRQAVRARLDAVGEIGAARELGLNKHTLLKIASGAPVWPATAIAAAMKLGLDLKGPVGG